jgi:hypothetical protein
LIAAIDQHIAHAGLAHLTEGDLGGVGVHGHVVIVGGLRFLPSLVTGGRSVATVSAIGFIPVAKRQDSSLPLSAAA